MMGRGRGLDGDRLSVAHHRVRQPIADEVWRGRPPELANILMTGRPG